MEINETPLPGIGLRHDFVTGQGRRVGVVTYRNGLRELLLYSRDDPDACSETVLLSVEEADGLAELLGAPRIVTRLAELHREAEGLVSRRLVIARGSPYDGRTLGDTAARTRTGVSIVAVVRDGSVIASPGPDFGFAAGDALLVVGTDEGLDAVERILDEG